MERYRKNELILKSGVRTIEKEKTEKVSEIYHKDAKKAGGAVHFRTAGFYCFILETGTDL
jgi:hypothetical protein